MPSDAVSARPDGKQVERLLTDYRNADGSLPGAGGDDSSALRAALAQGPGIVRLPAGSFLIGEATVTAGVTLLGAGRATVIRLAPGAKRVFVQNGVHDWRIRDALLDGGAATNTWPTRQDLGESGIELARCTGFELSGLVVNNFNGAGIRISYTAASPYCQWATAANLFNVAAGGNHTGVRFDTRAEYMNASMLSCQGNVIGCAVHAGNVKIANSTFTNNLTGILVEDHENGSHGAISNCLVNHNQSLALLARNVCYGMAFDNCAFFTGGIRIENSKGVNIASGIISCGITVAGEGVNRIAGNYMILREERIELTPATIVEGNFSENGPWAPSEREFNQRLDIPPRVAP